MNFEIIKASSSDLPALQDIGASSYLPHYQHLWLAGGVEWYMQRCFGTRVLQDELSDENIEYHFVRVDGENVGFAKIVLQKSVPNSSVENALYLEKVYFIKEFTGKGAGRRTIDFAVARAQELRRAAI